MHSHKSIYLAGPITGLSYDNARFGWRQVFAERMKVIAPHVECFSPMRAKEFLSGHQALECAGVDLEKVNNALCRPLGILARDSNDVAERDLIVANFLGADRVSIGTVWELGHAAAFRKKVIVIMEDEGNFHEHVFVTHNYGWRVNNLEEAALIAASVLTPGI